MRKRFNANVKEVIDGDTFETTYNVIRLENVDAPELREPGGPAAKQKLSDLIANKAIIYEEKARDKYSRIVAQVMVNGINVNDAMNNFLR